MTGVTLDAGALIALDRGDRRMVTLLARALEHGDRITVPATALAQALRSPARQVRVVRLCRQPSTDLIALDAPEATASGLLLASSGTSDIVDAHVIVSARRAHQAVLTSDPDDIARMAPDVIAIKV
ncbi:MAG: PIN domain-containing protein [Acidobacteriota bacterium]|nr:PIN domain-containing protein [Acidobacteriota bacterium]